MSNCSGHRAAATLSGLTLAGSAYLAVRISALVRAEHMVLSALALMLEAAAAFGYLAVVAVLLRPRPGLARRTVPRDTTSIIVRVPRNCLPEWLQVTLIALADLPSNRTAIVADAEGRAEIAALAERYGAGYHVVARRDRLALGAPIAAGVRWVGVLDAGDVPAEEFIDVLTSIAAPHFQIGVVQGAVRAVSERGVLESCRLRDSRFVAGQLNPALGGGGAGMWCGSGAVFSRAAWDDLCERPARHRRNETMASIVLSARGWRILASAAPMIVATPGSPPTAARVRQLRRHGMDGLVAGLSLRSSPFGRGGTLSSRIGALAWITVHTGPVRLAAALGIGAWALAAGASPVAWSPVAVACGLGFWGALLGTMVSQGNGTLRPGDGARRAIAGLFGGPLAILVLGRRHRRSAPRVPAEIAGSLAGQLARVVDLTVDGAGLVIPRALPVGTLATLMISLPRSNGRRTGAVVKSVVRYARADLASGGARIGVSFRDVEPDDLEALTQFCRVSFPRRLLRSEPTDATQVEPWSAPPPELTTLDARVLAPAGAHR